MKEKLDYLARRTVFIFPIFFLCGLVLFPDAPINPCGENQYCGKQYQPRTREDYELYRWWSSISPWLLALFFLSMSYVNRKEFNNIFKRK
jgi:hypothetical protein